MPLDNRIVEERSLPASRKKDREQAEKDQTTQKKFLDAKHESKRPAMMEQQTREATKLNQIKEATQKDE